MMKCTLNDLRSAAAQGPPYAPALLSELRSDDRAGAQALYAACLRRQARARSEEERLDAMLDIEREAWRNGFARVAGVDEAGRGPLAGPIVAAAVVLARPVPGLDDSKRLTAAQRDTLCAQLQEGGHQIGVAVVEAAEIDRYGIQPANYAAMARAVAALDPAPGFLLVDGFEIRGCPLPQKPVVKGDRLSQSIAAASIVAKVTRDRIMDGMDERFPGYGFARHKGYATQDHLAAIGRLGPCPVHRRSFAPLSCPAKARPLF